MMWGWGFDGVSWLLMALMMLFPLMVIVGIAMLIVWAIRRTDEAALGRSDQEGWRDRDRGQYREARSDEALEIVARRYANGEITREQYDEMVAALRR